MSVVLIEVVPPGGDWVESEVFWIAYFRSIGANLVNTTPGGEGVVGVKHPELALRNKEHAGSDEWKNQHRLGMVKRSSNKEGRKNVGASSKLRGQTPEGRERMRAVAEGNRGKRHSKETKAKMRATALLRGPTPDYVRKKISDKNKGHKKTDAQREAARLRSTGRKHSEETKLRIKEGNIGHVVTQETRNKIRDKALARWALKREGQ